MNRLSVVALALVSSAVLASFLFEQPASHRVLAASSAQYQAQPPKSVETTQTPSSQNGQPQQSNKNIVLTGSGTPLTPIEALQLQAAGLQMEIKALQDQSASQQNSIRVLQASLQTLQTQFANHSHKVTNLVPGHVCTGINQYLVTQAGTGKQVQVGLEVVQACSNPKWDGATPSSWQALNVSTPVEGAQTPQ